jgi:hypothetical protein
LWIYPHTTGRLWIAVAIAVIIKGNGLSLKAVKLLDNNIPIGFGLLEESAMYLQIGS